MAAPGALESAMMDDEDSSLPETFWVSPVFRPWTALTVGGLKADVSKLDGIGFLAVFATREQAEAYLNGRAGQVRAMRQLPTRS